MCLHQHVVPTESGRFGNGRQNKLELYVFDHRLLTGKEFNDKLIIIYECVHVCVWVFVCDWSTV